MYYEEKIINGVMHWRNTPTGEWNSHTVETLTAQYAALLRRNSDLLVILSDIHEKTDI